MKDESAQDRLERITTSIYSALIVALSPNGYDICKAQDKSHIAKEAIHHAEALITALDRHPHN